MQDKPSLSSYPGLSSSKTDSVMNPVYVQGSKPSLSMYPDLKERLETDESPMYDIDAVQNFTKTAEEIAEKVIEIDKQLLLSDDSKKERLLEIDAEVSRLREEQRKVAEKMNEPTMSNALSPIGAFHEDRKRIQNMTAQLRALYMEKDELENKLKPPTDKEKEEALLSFGIGNYGNTTDYAFKHNDFITKHGPKKAYDIANAAAEDQLSAADEFDAKNATTTDEIISYKFLQYGKIPELKYVDDSFVDKIVSDVTSTKEYSRATTPDKRKMFDKAVSKAISELDLKQPEGAKPVDKTELKNSIIANILPRLIRDKDGNITVEATKLYAENQLEHVRTMIELHKNAIEDAGLAVSNLASTGATRGMTGLVIGDNSQDVAAADSRVKELEEKHGKENIQAWYHYLRNEYHNLKDTEKELERMLEKPEARSGIRDIGKAFKTTEGKSIATFQISDMYKSLRMDKIFKKLETGDAISYADKKRLETYATLSYLDSLGNEGVIYNAMHGTISMIPYIASFAVSGGAFTGTKGAVQAALKGSTLAAKRVGIGKFKMGLGDMAARALGAGAQTAVLPQMYVKNISDLARDNASLIIDPALGEIAAKIDVNSGLDVGKAVGRGLWSTYSEVFTERMGPYIMKGLGISKKAVVEGVSKQQLFKNTALAGYMQLKGIKTVPELSKQIAKVTGWDGLFEEYLEELANYYMEGATHPKDLTLPVGKTHKEFFEQQLTTFLTVAGFSGIMKTGQVSAQKTIGRNVHFTWEQGGHTQRLSLPRDFYNEIVNAYAENKDPLFGGQITPILQKYQGKLSKDQFILTMNLMMKMGRENVQAEAASKTFPADQVAKAKGAPEQPGSILDKKFDNSLAQLTPEERKEVEAENERITKLYPDLVANNLIATDKESGQYLEPDKLTMQAFLNQINSKLESVAEYDERGNITNPSDEINDLLTKKALLEEIVTELEATDIQDFAALPVPEKNQQLEKELARGFELSGTASYVGRGPTVEVLELKLNDGRTVTAYVDPTLDKETKEAVNKAVVDNKEFSLRVLKQSEWNPMLDIVDKDTGVPYGDKIAIVLDGKNVGSVQIKDYRQQKSKTIQQEQNKTTAKKKAVASLNTVKPKAATSKVAEPKIEESKVQQTKAELDRLLRERKDKQGNIGFAFDPKSKAEDDIKLLKAWIDYLLAIGAETLEKIKAAIREFAGTEITDDQAQYILDEMTRQRIAASDFAKSLTPEEEKLIKEGIAAGINTITQNADIPVNEVLPTLIEAIQEDENMSPEEKVVQVATIINNQEAFLRKINVAATLKNKKGMKFAAAIVTADDITFPEFTGVNFTGDQKIDSFLAGFSSVWKAIADATETNKDFVERKFYNIAKTKRFHQEVKNEAQYRHFVASLKGVDYVTDKIAEMLEKSSFDTAKSIFAFYGSLRLVSQYGFILQNNVGTMKLLNPPQRFEDFISTFWIHIQKYRFRDYTGYAALQSRIKVHKDEMERRFGVVNRSYSKFEKLPPEEKTKLRIAQHEADLLLLQELTGIKKDIWAGYFTSQTKETFAQASRDSKLETDYGTYENLLNFDTYRNGWNRIQSTLAYNLWYKTLRTDDNMYDTTVEEFEEKFNRFFTQGDENKGAPSNLFKLSTATAVRDELASRGVDVEGHGFTSYVQDNMTFVIAENIRNAPVSNELTKFYFNKGTDAEIIIIDGVSKINKDDRTKVSALNMSSEDLWVHQLFEFMQQGESYNAWMGQFADKPVLYFIQAPKRTMPNRTSSKYSWSRYSDNGYEVSSTGDPIFSALNAKLKDGRTIEEAYQLDVKGYRSKGNDWRLGKGKNPLNGKSREQLYLEYKALWSQWASENPNLIQELATKAQGKVLTDKYASTEISQARALSEILNEQFASSKEWQAFINEFPEFDQAVDWIKKKVIHYYSDIFNKLLPIPPSTLENDKQKTDWKNAQRQKIAEEFIYNFAMNTKDIIEVFDGNFESYDKDLLSLVKRRGSSNSTGYVALSGVEGGLGEDYTFVLLDDMINGTEVFDGIEFMSGDYARRMQVSMGKLFSKENVPGMEVLSSVKGLHSTVSPDNLRGLTKGNIVNIDLLAAAFPGSMFEDLKKFMDINTIDRLSFGSTTKLSEKAKGKKDKEKKMMRLWDEAGKRISNPLLVKDAVIIRKTSDTYIQQDLRHDTKPETKKMSSQLLSNMRILPHGKVIAERIASLQNIVVSEMLAKVSGVNLEEARISWIREQVNKNRHEELLSMLDKGMTTFDPGYANLIRKLIASYITQNSLDIPINRVNTQEIPDPSGLLKSREISLDGLHVMLPDIASSIQGARYAEHKFKGKVKEAIDHVNANKEKYGDLFDSDGQLMEWEISMRDGIIPGEIIMSTRTPADDLHAHTVGRLAFEIKGGNFTMLDRKSQKASGSDFDGDQRFNWTFYRNKAGQVITGGSKEGIANDMLKLIAEDYTNPAMNDKINEPINTKANDKLVNKLREENKNRSHLDPRAWDDARMQNMTGVKLKGTMTDLVTVYSLINDLGIPFKKKIGIPIGKKKIALGKMDQESLKDLLFEIEEDQSEGYRERTIKNASADATIAIAFDFYSAGEKLTRSSVKNQGKAYIPINAFQNITYDLIDQIVDELNEAEAKTLNIAGNGIYTMRGLYSQEEVDKYTYELLSAVINSRRLKNKIISIRTGGQTGFDEAGAKAGLRLGINTTILAPKGYKFRDITGSDISDEAKFTARFEGFGKKTTTVDNMLTLDGVAKDSSGLLKIHLANLLNMAFDNAKDPKIEIMGINEITAPMFVLAMIGNKDLEKQIKEKGHSAIFDHVEKLSAYFTSPIMKEYVAAVRRGKGAIGELDKAELKYNIGRLHGEQAANNLFNLVSYAEDLSSIRRFYSLTQKMPNTAAELQEARQLYNKIVKNKLDFIDTRNFFDNEGHLLPEFKIATKALQLAEDFIYRDTFEYSHAGRKIYKAIYEKYKAASKSNDKSKIFFKQDEFQALSYCLNAIAVHRAIGITLPQKALHQKLKELLPQMRKDYPNNKFLQSITIARHGLNQFLEILQDYKYTTISDEKLAEIRKDFDTLFYNEPEFANQLASFAVSKWGTSTSTWKGSYFNLFSQDFRVDLSKKLMAEFEKWDIEGLTNAEMLQIAELTLKSSKNKTLRDMATMKSRLPAPYDYNSMATIDSSISYDALSGLEDISSLDQFIEYEAQHGIDRKSLIETAKTSSLSGIRSWAKEFVGKFNQEADRIFSDINNSNLKIRDMMPADVAGELLATDDPALSKFVFDHLRKTYPGVLFFESREEFEKFAIKNGAIGLNINPNAIGHAFANAVYIDPAKAVQSTLFHEYGHIYFDALPEDNKVKKALRSLYSEQMPGYSQEDIDEAIILDIGRAGVDIAKVEIDESLLDRFLNLLKRFWRDVRILFGQHDKNDLVQKLAWSVWSNKENIKTNTNYADAIIRNMVLNNNKADNVQFNGETHTHYIGDEMIAGVTSTVQTIMESKYDQDAKAKEQQIKFDFEHKKLTHERITQEESDEIRMKMAQLWNDMTEKGTVIHAVAESVFGNHIVTAEEKAEFININDYYNLVRQFEEEKKRILSIYPDAIFYTERQIISKKFKVGGFFDLVVDIGDNKLHLYDFKTSSYEYADNSMQPTERYKHAYSMFKAPFSNLAQSKFNTHMLQTNIYANILEEQEDPNQPGVKNEVTKITIIPIIRELENGKIKSANLAEHHVKIPRGPASREIANRLMTISLMQRQNFYEKYPQLKEILEKSGIAPQIVTDMIMSYHFFNQFIPDLSKTTREDMESFRMAEFGAMKVELFRLGYTIADLYGSRALPFELLFYNAMVFHIPKFEMSRMMDTYFPEQEVRGYYVPKDNPAATARRWHKITHEGEEYILQEAGFATLKVDDEVMMVYDMERPTKEVKRDVYIYSVVNVNQKAKSVHLRNQATGHEIVVKLPAKDSGALKIHKTLPEGIEDPGPNSYVPRYLYEKKSEMERHVDFNKIIQDKEGTMNNEAKMAKRRRDIYFMSGLFQGRFTTMAETEEFMRSSDKVNELIQHLGMINNEVSSYMASLLREVAVNHVFANALAKEHSFIGPPNQPLPMTLNLYYIITKNPNANFMDFDKFRWVRMAMPQRMHEAQYIGLTTYASLMENGYKDFQEDNYILNNLLKKFSGRKINYDIATDIGEDGYRYWRTPGEKALDGHPLEKEFLEIIYEYHEKFDPELIEDVENNMRRRIRVANVYMTRNEAIDKWGSKWGPMFYEKLRPQKYDKVRLTVLKPERVNGRWEKKPDKHGNEIIMTLKDIKEQYAYATMSEDELRKHLGPKWKHIFFRWAGTENVWGNAGLLNEYIRRAEAIYRKGEDVNNLGTILESTKNTIPVIGKGISPFGTKEFVEAEAKSLKSMIFRYYMKDLVGPLEWMINQYSPEDKDPTEIMKYIKEWGEYILYNKKPQGTFAGEKLSDMIDFFNRLNSLNKIMWSFKTQGVNVAIGQTFNMIREPGMYFRGMGKIAKNPASFVKAMNLAKSLGIANIVDDAIFDQIDKEMRILGVDVKKIEDIGYKWMEWAEKSNQIPILIGSMTDEEWDAYDISAAVIPGKEKDRLTDYRRRQILYRIQDIHGDYSAITMAPWFAHNSGKAFMQFKKWIPALIWSQIAPYHIDRNLMVRSGIIPTVGILAKIVIYNNFTSVGKKQEELQRIIEDPKSDNSLVIESSRDYFDTLIKEANGNRIKYKQLSQSDKKNARSALLMVVFKILMYLVNEALNNGPDDPDEYKKFSIRNMMPLLKRFEGDVFWMYSVENWEYFTTNMIPFVSILMDGGKFMVDLSQFIVSGGVDGRYKKETISAWKGMPKFMLDATHFLPAGSFIRWANQKARIKAMKWTKVDLIDDYGISEEFLDENGFDSRYMSVFDIREKAMQYKKVYQVMKDAATLDALDAKGIGLGMYFDLTLGEYLLDQERNELSDALNMMRLEQMIENGELGSSYEDMLEKARELREEEEKKKSKTKAKIKKNYYKEIENYK